MALLVSRAPVLARRRPVRSSLSVQDESCAQLENIDVQEVFQQRVPMLKTCPHFLKGQKLEAEPVGEERAWKLFTFVPIMLWHRSRNTGCIGRSELAQRVEDFDAGRWSELLCEARREVVRGGEPQCKSDEKARRGAAAQRRVERCQISRARLELIGASLVPKNADTVTELRNKRPQEVQSPIPQHVLDFAPECELKLEPKVFATCLRTALCGSSPGPGGCTYEMLKVCLNDNDTLQLLTLAAEDFARAQTPATTGAFMMTTMTALQKDGVSGALQLERCSDALLPRVWRASSAMRWNPRVPHSSSLSPLGQGRTVWTSHSRSNRCQPFVHSPVHRHVFRSSMTRKIWEVPGFRSLLPFVRSVYQHPSQ